jgi:protease IV
MSDDPAASPPPDRSPPGLPGPATVAAPGAPASRGVRAATKKPSRAGLVALIVFLLLPLGLCVPLCLLSGPPGVQAGTILELDLEEPLDEAGLAGPIPFLPSQGRTLMDVLLALEKAKSDPKVKGLIARVGAGQSLATVQELREALASFRAAGKPAVAWSEGFGEMSPGVSGYVLATAFDEIWLQPSGDVGLSGLFGEAMFLRGALDKLGVEPQLSGRKEYKSAIEQFTETGFTPASREAMERLLQSLTEQIVDDILASRPSTAGGTREGVRALLEGGPLGAQQALAQGLVDKLGYKDEAFAAVKARVGGEPDVLWLQRYAERAGVAYADKGAGPAVALILAKGAVMRGKNSVDPLSGGQSFGSDTTSAAIRAATDDDEVKVILLRVDSPGGSYVASDTIWRALEQAKARGKRVVVSMGDLAASGGYFVSMGADRIVADRATITGSIGVYAGKLVTAGMWEKIGVAFEAVAASPEVDPSHFSNDVGYSPAARKTLEATLDRIYLDFTTKAAEGRKMPLEKLEPLARGRIWSGADAKEHGLIDETGGFLRAIEAAREVAGIEKGAPLRLRSFPKKRPPLEELLAILRGEPGENSDDVSSAGASLIAPDALRAARVLARLAAGLDGAGGRVLEAPLPRIAP